MLKLEVPDHCKDKPPEEWCGDCGAHALSEDNWRWELGRIQWWGTNATIALELSLIHLDMGDALADTCTLCNQPVYKTTADFHDTEPAFVEKVFVDSLTPPEERWAHVRCMAQAGVSNI